MNGVEMTLRPTGYRKILNEVERSMEVPVADPAQREIIARLELNGILMLEAVRSLREIHEKLVQINGS